MKLFQTLLGALLLLYVPGLHSEGPITKSLQLYGGKSLNIYLGCLNCPATHASSIWNKASKHGNVTSSISVWNKKGEYGSRTSDMSPWNRNAKHPPIILDDEGGIYGRFTLNRDKSPTNIEWADWILNNYEEVLANLEKYRVRFGAG